MQAGVWPEKGDLELWLNTKALSTADANRWHMFITQGLRAAGFDVVLHTNRPHPFGPNDAFVAASSSAALSRKLLHNFRNWVLTPAQAPRVVDAWLFSVLQAQGLANSLHLSAARRACSLVSSVFNADEYISGFLDNVAELQGYGDTEHLLIRPGSTGQEHEVLLQHTSKHPGAFYINLPRDPGLYDVWNLGCRLASGRLISNANVDDRRAPDQLVHLRVLLDQSPTAVAASTALRVSQQKNLPWSESAHCKVWFGQLGNRLLDGADLFSQRDGYKVSHNVPHCMPLWRRSLHGWAGEFNQRRYGASADWAFWLKAAAGRSRFVVSAEPRGLYLQDEGTFWRREKASGAVDRNEAHVLADFGWLSDQGQQVTEKNTETLTAVTLRAMDRLRMGAVLDALADLLTAWSERSTAELAMAQPSVTKMGQVFFGVAALPQLLEARAGLAAHDREVGLWALLVDVVHDCVATSGEQAWRWLEWACVDWCDSRGGVQGWLLLAWLAKRQGQADRETHLLRGQHEAAPAVFWAEVQSAYRFGRPLAELSALVGAATPQPMGLSAPHLKVRFFPDYSQSNAYQTLLYEPWRMAGAQVEPASNWTEFLGMPGKDETGQVLHLHWLSPLFGRGLTNEQLQLHTQALLTKLAERKAQGATIHWTVHNEMSHETSARQLETLVQRDISLLADRVWIHHPMASHLLSWLPAETKLALQEHGTYAAPNGAASDKKQARQALGLPQDAFVLVHTGLVRPYKGLDRWLPHMLEILEEFPRMVLFLAGRISCQATLVFLHKHPHPRLVVLNQILDETTLHQCMVAADVGFLSYRRVLTSGSLAHWLGVGRPVLAPALGTLPAYVVPGWNGFLYNDAQSMMGWLRYCLNQPEALGRMASQAAQTGSSLSWGGPETKHDISGETK